MWRRFFRLKPLLIMKAKVVYSSFVEPLRPVPQFEREPKRGRRSPEERRQFELAVWQMWVGGKSTIQIASHFDMNVLTLTNTLRRLKAEAAENEPTLAEFRQMIVHGTLDVISVMTDRLHSAPNRAYSNGKAITNIDENGVETPAWDYAMQMAAADRILKAHERLAKITGVEAPTEHAVTVTVQAQEMAEAAAREALARLSMAAELRSSEAFPHDHLPAIEATVVVPGDEE
jgi:hypothetical protein